MIVVIQKPHLRHEANGSERKVEDVMRAPKPVGRADLPQKVLQSSW